jgi:hypothetical protein
LFYSVSIYKPVDFLSQSKHYNEIRLCRQLQKSTGTAFQGAKPAGTIHKFISAGLSDAALIFLLFMKYQKFLLHLPVNLLQNCNNISCITRGYPFVKLPLSNNAG